MVTVDKKKRREDLLSAARNVFATKGYHDAKVDDIVAEAKVAKGTFYLYFKDKRSVFAELVDRLFLRIGAAILRVDVAADVESQVKHNIRAVIAVLLDDPTMTRILLSYAPDPAFVAKLRSFYDGAKRLMHKALVDGQKMGIVAPGDVDLFASFTIGAIKEVLLECVTAERARPREELVESFFRLLENGYLRVRPEDAADPPVSPVPSRAKRPDRRKTPVS